ncbi:hypothetical protein GCK32_006007, partial [Trichostrongylus colubriformis]
LALTMKALLIMPTQVQWTVRGGEIKGSTEFRRKASNDHNRAATCALVFLGLCDPAALCWPVHNQVQSVSLRSSWTETCEEAWRFKSVILQKGNKDST